MLIGFVVACIILYLLISSYFRKFKDADEKTLRPMPEWAIIANSSTRNNRDRMCYSLVIQAGTVLEGSNVTQLSVLRKIMMKPNFSKSNFVLLIISLVPNIVPESEQEGLKRQFNEEQARVYLACCIDILLIYGGYSKLEEISINACREPMAWN